MKTEERIRRARRARMAVAEYIFDGMSYEAYMVARNSLSEEGREVFEMMTSATENFGAFIGDVWRDAIDTIDGLSHEDQIALDRFVARQSLIDKHRREFDPDDT
jgi:hypothetical protein